MSKSITVSLEQNPKTYTRSDNSITNYFEYCVIISGVPVRLKPSDSTAKAILEREFSIKGK